MTDQRILLEAIGDDGIIQRWFRRPYNRRLRTDQILFDVEQEQNEGESSNQQLPEILNSKNTSLQELGIPLLVCLN
jgi:hypothetical protein